MRQNKRLEQRACVRSNARCSKPLLLRHDWVWLRQDWQRHLRSPLEPLAHAELTDWLAGERPLVVTRRLPGDSLDDLRLGLARPGRWRIALHLSVNAIARLSLSPSPLEVLGDAPGDWRERLDWLVALGCEQRVPMGVYGSLAWQHFAGSANGQYLTCQSDLDLLFMPSSWTAVERLVKELTASEGCLPGPRLDGEIILPDGGGIAWRELAARPPTVLVKTIDSVELRPFAAVPLLFERRDA